MSEMREILWQELYSHPGTGIHFTMTFIFFVVSTTLSKKIFSVSRGPGFASGCYWTDIISRSLCFNPSTVLSLVLYWVIVISFVSMSYTHLRAHETRHDLVCRLLLEKK